MCARKPACVTGDRHEIQLFCRPLHGLNQLVPLIHPAESRVLLTTAAYGDLVAAIPQFGKYGSVARY
jgi:hypothetical protein